MPTRILREGILTSERVNSLGWQAEVFYRRLMSVVDDYGRYHAHGALLRAALYPLKLDTVRDAEMDSLLAEVEAAGLVRTYAVDGKRYVQMLDFRQQVRAQKSKYPAPPDERCAPAQQAPGNPAAFVHLGVGAGEVKDVIEGEGGGAAAHTPAPPGGQTASQAEAQSLTSAAPPLHVQIAVKLSEAGVNITSAHPHAQAWAARGLTVPHALEAVAIARQRKPQGRIAANYLAPIVEDLLNPRLPPQGKAAAPPAWWASEAATLARGRELGLHARPGEAMSEYRARLSAAHERPGAAPP